MLTIAAFDVYDSWQGLAVTIAAENGVVDVIDAGDFDGLAIAYFDDAEHLRRTLASPDISKDAFADEQRFIAHSRSQFLPFAAVNF